MTRRDTGKVGCLICAAQAGMGQADLGKIEIVGPALKDHIETFKDPAKMEQLLNWQERARKAYLLGYRDPVDALAHQSALALVIQASRKSVLVASAFIPWAGGSSPQHWGAG